MSVYNAYKNRDIGIKQKEIETINKVQYNYCLFQMSLELRIENNLSLFPNSSMGLIEISGEMEK